MSANRPLVKQDINKRVFANIGDALYNATFMPKEALFQISDLLNLDISQQNYHRQQYIDEMVEQIQGKYGGIVSFLRRNFPAKNEFVLAAMVVLTLGIVAELSIYTTTGLSTTKLVSSWLLFISLASSIVSTSYVFSIIRNYFTSSSQSNLLKIINLVERSSAKELQEINHCIYVPLWRKLGIIHRHPCKFSLKSWIKSGFRGGWTIDESNIDMLKNSPYQEGLLEVLRLAKLKKVSSNS